MGTALFGVTRAFQDLGTLLLQKAVLLSIYFIRILVTEPGIEPIMSPIFLPGSGHRTSERSMFLEEPRSFVRT